MPDRISIHKPLFVNTLGHCAGVAIFGILLSLFVLDWYRSGRSRSKLSAIAAGLALLWNLGSLIALGSNPHGSGVTDFLIGMSFCVLSLLPAVLLHISTQAQHSAIWISGYVISAIAIIFHIVDLVTNASTPHRVALLLVTFGFSGLTLISVLLSTQRLGKRGAGSRLAVSMCLFLIAISFVHFGTGDGSHLWTGELALHHAGIPLALFVLLYDYRFLFLDAFLRFAVNGALAAFAALFCIGVEIKFHLLSRAASNPFAMALLFVAGCVFLAGFAQLRAVTQRMLTRVLFHRASVDPVLNALRDLGISSITDQDYIKDACQTIANFFGASIVEIKKNPPELEFHQISVAVPLLEWSRWRRFKPAPAAQAVLPLHFSNGDLFYLLLGERYGGRPYLSEDITLLSRLGKVIEEQMEKRRQTELQALASQAELRALQAQINPHFFFNSLNTLYGTISRNNAEARRLVLNLADVFRYFLRSERTFITIEEELKIIRAYLEIEELRLGPKLSTTIDVEDSVLKAEIPVLSIQPLVENAVKHGVADRSEQGFVCLTIKNQLNNISIEVSNSGEFSLEHNGNASGGAGVGMANVRRRLNLCYGKESDLHVISESGKTTVTFYVPHQRVATHR